ncbi:TrkA family potassium uptake protein, partial [Sharpea azabuensis]|uniref:potassium channel family protein n=1 Tax=Sharpea azabuensis TaxID=322505 RepID=UPI002E8182FF
MSKTKQVAILGLGIFGSTLAETLEDYGVEVLAVDIDPACVERIADNVTRAVVADVTDKDQLLELGVADFDTAVVAISKHFEESVLCTMILKEAGIKNVIVKARTKRKKMILEKVGADKVINVEKDMAYKVAKSLLRRSIVDLVELDSEYSIVEIKVMPDWVA